MAHLQDLMDRQNEALIKEACEKLDSMEEKVAMGFHGDSLMTLLGPIFQASPPANMDAIRDLLGQVVQQELQQQLTKKEMDAASDPLDIQKKKLQTMADLLRSKVRIADLQKELIETQEELASKIRMNPTLQATMQNIMGATGETGGAPGQMPLPGGPPGMPGAPPPALPPPAAPAAMGAAPPQAAPPSAAPAKPLPASPMEAITKTAPKQ